MCMKDVHIRDQGKQATEDIVKRVTRRHEGLFEHNHPLCAL
jgi:hypothetical protein